jgi:hypothetical protein
MSSTSIRNQFNVSSISRIGAGTQQVNFTTALADANYAVTVSATGESSGSLGVQTPLFTSNSPASLTTPTASSFTFTTWRFNYATTFDSNYCCAIVNRT